jgi:hypothetical protein
MMGLSRTCDSITTLICYALFMFMIYPWIKIKLKVFIFSTAAVAKLGFKGGGGDHC